LTRLSSLAYQLNKALLVLLIAFVVAVVNI